MMSTIFKPSLTTPTSTRRSIRVRLWRTYGSLEGHRSGEDGMLVRRDPCHELGRHLEEEGERGGFLSEEEGEAARAGGGDGVEWRRYPSLAAAPSTRTAGDVRASLPGASYTTETSRSTRRPEARPRSPRGSASITRGR